MKTKALISFAVTAKLICVFVFAYTKIWFSHDAAHIVKLGFTAGIIYFSCFCSKERLWVLVHVVRTAAFYVLSKNKKKYNFFLSENCPNGYYLVINERYLFQFVIKTYHVFAEAI